uniref:Uncharacterized protein n=1 Tax=Hippocampus comes TaxID=109280 RepID=A0A3Q3DB44_HIPCM
MEAPFSSFFSMSTSNLTPSTTIWTSCTSENPSLSAFEMSKIPSTAAVSTPPGQTKCLGILWGRKQPKKGACSCLECPGWMGKSGCSLNARST